MFTNSLRLLPKQESSLLSEKGVNCSYCQTKGQQQQKVLKSRPWVGEVAQVGERLPGKLEAVSSNPSTKKKKKKKKGCFLKNKKKVDLSSNIIILFKLRELIRIYQKAH
jgi:hypothetical protein